LFAAVELSAAARAEVAAACAEMRRAVAAAEPMAKITWVAPERLHLTVRFIGEVEEPLAARIAASLGEPVPCPPFALTFAGFGAFPESGPPRVLWVGVAAGRDVLLQAESAIGDRLSALGIARERRAYSPHLTLARVRDPRRLQAARLFAGLADPSAVTQVDAITLFRSRLSPRGPEYTALARTPLAGG
jgi:2'-5' RNA ligase